MSKNHEEILLKANAAVQEGNHEGFLAFCSDDIKWTFVGDQVLEGKEAIREYMAQTYLTPPEFNIETTIAEGDFLTVIGTINLKDENDKTTYYEYCDIWTFKDGLMTDLKAFVIESKG